MDALTISLSVFENTACREDASSDEEQRADVGVAACLDEAINVNLFLLAPSPTSINHLAPRHGRR